MGWLNGWIHRSEECRMVGLVEMLGLVEWIE